MMIRRDDDDDAVILNEDLVFQILSWLPVISLLRFKSVCKSWCSLIQTSSFINHHLSNQNKSPSSKYIIVGNNVGRSLWNSHAEDILRAGGWAADLLNRALTLPLITFSSHNFQIPPTKLEFDSPILRQFVDKDIHILACNGLVCLQTRDLDRTEGEPISLFLWNPATRHVLDLPQPSSPPRVDDFLFIYLGFGFDVSTSQYKLLRIFLYEKQVHIYSLTTDSWRILEIDPAVLPQAIPSYPRVPYRNTMYCWLGRNSAPKPKDMYDFILTFDFTNEVFGTMPLPLVFDDPDHYCFISNLAIVRDNIAYITILDDFSSYEVWVLNQYGVRESWAKLYKLGPFTEAMKLGLSQDGDFLVFINKSLRRLCIYNVVTQETEEIPVQLDFNFDCCYFNLQLVEYKESLVSVRRRNAANSLTSVSRSELDVACPVDFDKWHKYLESLE